MKNNINKITLISTLLLSTMAPAKNFHTCIPKKEWVEKIIKEKEDKNWELVNNGIKLKAGNRKSYFLNIEDLKHGNIYKFVEPTTGKNYILNIPFSYDLEETRLSSSCELDIKKTHKFQDRYIFYYLCNVYIDGNFLGKISVVMDEYIIIKIYKKK